MILFALITIVSNEHKYQVQFLLLCVRCGKLDRLTVGFYGCGNKGITVGTSTFHGDSGSPAKCSFFNWICWKLKYNSDALEFEQGATLEQAPEKM